MAAKIKMPKTLFSEQGQRAVILLHAYSGSPNDVRMLHRFLEKHNYTVYSPMFTGHGTMEPLDILEGSTTVWEQDVQDALRFLKEKGYRKIAVFGLSMGGIFAAHTLTLADQEIIGGGVFCSPIYPTKNQVPENFVKYAQQVYRYSTVAGEQLATNLAKVQQGVQQQLQDIEELGRTTSENLAKIQVPVFLAQAGKDEMIDPKTVFRTAQGITQVPFTLKWYPESQHVITVDPVHKDFERDVLDFIEGLAWNEGEE